MANIDDLRTLAQQIKNETNVGANTANRVGTTFEKTVTELETLATVNFIEKVSSDYSEQSIFTTKDCNNIFKYLQIAPYYGKVYLSDTNYWTPAILLMDSNQFLVHFHEKKLNDSWGRSVEFNIPYSDISIKRGLVEYSTTDGRLIVDIDKLREKWESLEGTLEINDVRYVINRRFISDVDIEHKLNLLCIEGIQNPHLFKNHTMIDPRFLRSFLDIKYNGDISDIDEYAYGLVYISVKPNGIYFENYKRNRTTGTWSDISDRFVIPLETALENKVNYYKSPAGKFEFLANFYELIKDITIPTSGETVILGASVYYEFTDRVFSQNNFTSLIDLYNVIENTKDVVKIDPSNGKFTTGYPDSKMISDHQFEIRDDSDIRDFATYSVIQWCMVAYEAFINTVTLDLVYAPDSRCVIKIFNSTDEFGDALNENVGTKIFDRVITTDDYIDTNLYQARVTIPNKVYVEKGKIIAAIYINKDGGEGSTIHIRYIGRNAPYTPIQDGTVFWWKSNYAQQNYQPSAIQPEFAYYQLPLLFNSNFPLEKRVDKLEKDTAKIDFDVNNPRLVLPSKLYALVGKEFNLYYDAFALLPDLGTPQPNMLFDITCSIGVTKARCFRLTPTANQVGEYPMTIRAYSSFEKLLAIAQTTLVVVPAQNPSSQKRILCVGDSTTDDTAQVVFGIRDNLDEISGGVSPLLVGHKPYYNNPSVNHGASTGKNFNFFANGITVLKINMVNLPNDVGVYPNLTFTLMDNTGYIVNIRTEFQGSGKAYSIADVWRAGSSPVDTSFTGQLRTNGVAGFPSVVDVESVEILNNYSPFRYNGNLDFAQYATSIGLSNNEKIDLFSIDLGINDSRGAIQSESTRNSILNNAKALAEAFHSYNPNGKIMFCLPKSCSNPRSNNSAYHDTYRSNIHALRENLIKTFDGNSNYPYCYVCNSGLSIDRFYGYPISTEPAAARYTETVAVNTDDVHPRSQGYNQVADAMVSCMLYILNL